MKRLVESFQSHQGYRGVHFYNEDEVNFLPWDGVIKFLEEIYGGVEAETFKEKLASTLANYDPKKEFLAVRQSPGTLSVELYADASQMAG